MLGLLVAWSAVQSFAQDLPGRNPRHEAVVWIDVTRNLIEDGNAIGVAATRFELACNGDVVWIDINRSIYKNDRHVGVNATSYRLYDDGGVAWDDAAGFRHID